MLSWHTKKQKGNDQDLTKYLINDCSSFWIIRVCMLVYGLQTVLFLAQSVPGALKKGAQGGLCICRDGSVSMFCRDGSVSSFSEFIDY